MLLQSKQNLIETSYISELKQVTKRFFFFFNMISLRSREVRVNIYRHPEIFLGGYIWGHFLFGNLYFLVYLQST